jgi:cytochrome c-type biogenesis protein
MNATIALALAAGMAATVNPCGFALLPAYLSAFVGLDDEGATGKIGAVRRALTVSAALTTGFVLVFGLFGLIVTPFALRIETSLPWVTIVIGLGLAGLGIALLAGRQLALSIPKLNRGGRDGTLPSMFLFGVSYAVASLSCTIGPFLAVTTSSFRSDSWLAGLGVFVAYGVGMGIVVTTLTVAVALAKTGLVSRIRGAIPTINRVAGGLLVVAGLYVAYYGWYEIRVLRGSTSDPLVDRAIAIQNWLQRTIVPDDPLRVATIAVALIAALVMLTTVARRRRRSAPGLADIEAHGHDRAAQDEVDVIFDSEDHIAVSGRRGAAADPGRRR